MFVQTKPRGRPPVTTTKNKNNNNAVLIGEIKKLFTNQELNFKSELNLMGQNLESKISDLLLEISEIKSVSEGNKQLIIAHDKRIASLESNSESLVVNMQDFSDEIEERIHRQSNIIITGNPESITVSTNNKSAHSDHQADQGKVLTIINSLTQQSKQSSQLNGISFKVRRLGTTAPISNNNNITNKPRLLKVMFQYQNLRDLFKLEFIKAKTIKCLPTEMVHYHLMDDLTAQQQQQLKALKANAVKRGEMNVTFKKVGSKFVPVKKRDTAVTQLINSNRSSSSQKRKKSNSSTPEQQQPKKQQTLAVVHHQPLDSIDPA